MTKYFMLSNCWVGCSYAHVFCDFVGDSFLPFFFLTDLSIDSVVPRTGEKDKLDVASGPEFYHEVHQKYHPTCSREKGWTQYS